MSYMNPQRYRNGDIYGGHLKNNQYTDDPYK